MCATKKPLTNYLVLEIPLTAGTKSYTLPQDGTLDAAKRIISFRPMYAYDAGMKSPEGAPLCDAATFKSGYLTIAKKGTENPIQNMPLPELALIPSTNGNTQPPVQFDITGINTTACKVLFGDVTAVTTGDVLLIGVEFEI